MPPRDPGAFAPIQSSEIRNFVLQNRLGLIPDTTEDYLSLEAIAAILGLSKGTLENKMPTRLAPRHVLGPYVRLSAALEAMEKHAQESAKN